LTRLDEQVLARLRHDLGGPLSVIVGYASLLGMRADERLRLEAAKQIGDAAVVLTERIDELFDLFETEEATEPHEPVRVLVVDDDPHLRGLLRATFDAGAFEFTEASESAEALDLLDPLPAVVVLDWHLPGSSGAELLGSLKRAHPELPVVVLTGDLRGGEREAADALGADAYVTKPFSPLQLLATIETLAEQGQAANGGQRHPDPGQSSKHENGSGRDARTDDTSARSHAD
jgi:CheY-like chemotaxis protein